MTGFNKFLISSESAARAPEVRPSFIDCNRLISEEILSFCSFLNEIFSLSWVFCFFNASSASSLDSFAALASKLKILFTKPVTFSSLNSFFNLLPDFLKASNCLSDSFMTIDVSIRLRLFIWVCKSLTLFK